MADHDVLDDVDGMEEVVAVLGAAHCDDIVLHAGLDTHAAKGVDALLGAQLLAKLLLDEGHRAAGLLLEMVGHCDLAAILRVLGQDDLDGKDLEAHVGHVACQDVGRQEDVVDAWTRDVDEEVAVTDLDGAGMGAVDDRREAQRLALVVVEVGIAGFVGDDVAVLPSLRMLLEDLAQRQLLVHAKGHEGRLVGVGPDVVDRIGDQVVAEDSDRDRLPLAPEVLAQLLLTLDQVDQQLLGDGASLGGEAYGEVADAQAALVVDVDPVAAVHRPFGAGEEVVAGNLSALVCPKGAGDAGGGPEVGPVGVVELDLYRSILMSVELGLGHREDVVHLVVAVAAAGEGVEKLLRYFDLGHQLPLLILTLSMSGVKSSLMSLSPRCIMAMRSMPSPQARTGTSRPSDFVTSGRKMPLPPSSNQPSTGCLMWTSIEGSVNGK